MLRTYDMKQVRMNVEEYFKKHLPGYTVLEIRKKSVFPEDNYLFMVSAIKEDGSFAVWTCWNETSQSLNYGHYNLHSIEDCKKIFEEFYNNGK